MLRSRVNWAAIRRRTDKRFCRVSWAVSLAASCIIFFHFLSSGGKPESINDVLNPREHPKVKSTRHTCAVSWKCTVWKVKLFSKQNSYFVPRGEFQWFIQVTCCISVCNSFRNVSPRTSRSSRPYRKAHVSVAITFFAPLENSGLLRLLLKQQFKRFLPFEVFLVDKDDSIDRIDTMDVIDEITLSEIRRYPSIGLRKGLKTVNRKG